jgi:1,4-dihydroxy-2-naphthoate octaprenyltransferase
MLVVGAGQGALAFLAAWAAARGEMRSAASPDGLIGAATATLFIVALYPISQLYQTGEDAARGDRTLAVVWGPARCFAFAVASTLLAGMCMALLLSRRFSFLDGLIVAVGVAAQVGTLIVWSHRFDARRVTANYRAVMRFNGASAGALGAYVLARLMLVG